MIRPTTLVLALILTATGGPALAQGAAGCPPGLAKKAVPCVPPGLAKKGLRHDERTGGRHGLRIGDRYDHDRLRYDRIRDRGRWNLPRIGDNETYYRDGRVVYRVDETTRRILAVLRLAEIAAGG